MMKPSLFPGAALLVLSASACGDPAEWRPAKGAREAPAVKDAYRIPQPADGCEKLGIVHAEGEKPLDDIAATAARHGGTHDVVRNEHRETSYTGVGVTGGGLTAVKLEPEVDRKMWAEVYRCP